MTVCVVSLAKATPFGCMRKGLVHMHPSAVDSSVWL